jgi:hypothetical protein
MKKFILVGLSISIILLGGCGVETNEVKKAHAEKEQKRPKDMDPQDLPQVTAFQDEKTREFMVSTKEEEPGYYLLEGKSKKFRMLFPENGEYLERVSSFLNKNEETIAFTSYDIESNISLEMSVMYYNGHSFVTNLETMLDIVSGKNGYDGEYQREEVNDIEVYYSVFKNVHEDIKRKYNYSYRYFGFIKPIEQNKKAIEFSIRFGCKNDNQACSLEENYVKEESSKIIKSIQFLGDK